MQRPQDLAEEIANALTHGLGLVGSLAAVPLLALSAGGHRDAWHRVGDVVFGVTLVLLYLASTLYHACPMTRLPRVKHAFRVLDHAAIYLLIAGTYTPFALGPLRGPFGWTLLAIVWALALAGIVAKLVAGFRWPRLSTALYLGMGWMGLIAAVPLVRTLGGAGFAWLIGGGVSYTAGVVFYVRDHRTRYCHAIWHLFVAGGSACHLVAVVQYARVGG